eukprot:1031198-Rhodomonas_salina.1
MRDAGCGLWAVWCEVLGEMWVKVCGAVGMCGCACASACCHALVCQEQQTATGSAEWTCDRRCDAQCDARQ